MLKTSKGVPGGLTPVGVVVWCPVCAQYGDPHRQVTVPLSGPSPEAALCRKCGTSIEAVIEEGDLTVRVRCPGRRKGSRR